MLKPLNDSIKVEIEVDEYGYGSKISKDINVGTAEEGIECGILREIPDETIYFGFKSFAFDKSLGEDNVKVMDFYRKLIGKKVYWMSYSERGTIQNEGDKAFAFIKATDLIAYEDNK